MGDLVTITTTGRATADVELKTANSGSSDHAFRYELIRLSGCN